MPFNKDVDHVQPLNMFYESSSAMRLAIRRRSAGT
jgi:hypothetical protein